MSKSKIKWDSDKIVSLSAMSISVITLVIFIYQTNLMSRQNYLSILPYLSISTSDSPGDNSFKLSLENHGVGPAIIEKVTFKYKDSIFDLTEYNDEIFTFLLAKAPELDSIKTVSYSTLERGTAIPSNTSNNIIEVKNSPDDYVLLQENLGKLLADGLYYEVIYRSIQNERWMINNHTQGPKKLN